MTPALPVADPMNASYSSLTITRDYHRIYTLIQVKLAMKTSYCQWFIRIEIHRGAFIDYKQYCCACGTSRTGRILLC